MIKKFPIYVSIIAALAVILFGLAFNMDSFEIIKRVIIFIVASLVIGNIIQFYFNKKVFYSNDDEQEEESDEDGEDDSIDFSMPLEDGSGDAD